MDRKRKRKKGKSLFSLSALLASFFGAAMIAGAFAYFNYKFSEYKFIDFKQMVFYEKDAIFKPSQPRYIVIFFSSKQRGVAKKIANLQLRYPILAIDYYAQPFTNTKNTTFLRSGTNTTLKFIQRFNIYDLPTIFFIRQEKEFLYKQDSMIRKLDNLDQLSKIINSL